MLRRSQHLARRSLPGQGSTYSSPAALVSVAPQSQRRSAASSASASAAAAPEASSRHSVKSFEWTPFGPGVRQTKLPTPLPADVTERQGQVIRSRLQSPRKVSRRGSAQADKAAASGAKDVVVDGQEALSLSSLSGASLSSLDADEAFYPTSRAVENLSVLMACLNTGLVSRAAKLFADLRAEEDARLALERQEARKASSRAESSAMARKRLSGRAPRALAVSTYNSVLRAYLRKAWQGEDLASVQMWVDRSMALLSDMESGRDAQGNPTADPKPNADTLATIAKGLVRLENSKRSSNMNQLQAVLNVARDLGISLRDVIHSSIRMDEAEEEPSILGASKEGEPDARMVLERLSATAVETADTSASRELGDAAAELNNRAREAETKEGGETKPSELEDLAELKPTLGTREPNPVFNLSLLQQNLSVVQEAKATFTDPHERQKWLEHSALEAARKRLEHGASQLQELGLQNAGVLQSRQLQGWMWEWYNKLEKVLREDIARIRETEQAVKRGAASAKANFEASLIPFLSLLPPNKLALITILELMRAQGTGGVADGMKTTRALVGIGRSVELEYHSEVLRKTPSSFRNARKAQQEIRRSGILDFAARKEIKKWIEEKGGDKALQEQLPRWPQTTRARVGSYLVSHLMQVATVHREAKDRDGVLWKEEQPAFYSAYQYLQGKKLGVIKLNEVVARRLDKESVHETLHPRLLPMLVPPKPWLSHDSGGYYSVRSSAMRFKDSAEQGSYLRAASEADGLEIVLAGLDVLGQTAWKMNRKVFDVVSQVWNSGEGLADIPPLNLGEEEPQRPDNYDTDIAARGVYMQRLKQHNLARAANHSQRCDTNYKLEIARAFMSERFYFPHNMDFRGRAYPIPPHLNHIGNDLCRGLLLFADAKPLGKVGLRWLRIHLANVHGYDKASFAEREEFAIRHEKEMRACAADPLGPDGRWWLKADDPWQCLATCFELTAALDHPEGPESFPSNLPVHQDGTCNGLQHYAALGGDLAGAKQVNLSQGDRPSDVYTGVADLVIKVIDHDAEHGEPAVRALAQKLQGKVTRKVVKQTVMTTVYGVTFIGAKNQVMRQLSDRGDVEVEDLWHCASYLAAAIMGCIGDLFSGAEQIQNWLSETAKLIAKSIPPERIEEVRRAAQGEGYGAAAAGRRGPASRKAETESSRLAKEQMTSVIWTTALGLPVVQPYRKLKKRQVPTAMQTVYIHDPHSSSEVSPAKQASAFPPNFIHSLDATHMVLTALECQTAGLTFASVHDSYWTHACDIDTMSDLIRDTFVRLHSCDILQKLRDEFLERYKDYQIPVVAARELIRRREANKAARSRGKARAKAIAEASDGELTRAEAKAAAAAADEAGAVIVDELPEEEGGRMRVMRTEQGSLAEGIEARGRKGQVADEEGRAEEESEDADEDLESDDADADAEGEAPTKRKRSKPSPALAALEGLGTTAAGSGMATRFVKLSDLLPEIPKKGSFDVNEIKRSLYFFS